MLRIGDLFRMSRLPVKPLRCHDEVGLFKPVCVDRYAGCRDDADEQLPRLNGILTLTEGSARVRVREI